MTLGIDFDNTIVDYDQVFHQVARERGLIGPEVAANKAAVRSALVRQGREDVWTEMQGDVYGARMLDARPFPGVLEFFRRAVRNGVSVYIVSHKTRHPYLGPKHDLHQAARGWLEHHGFHDPARIGLDRAHVFFELTKREKLERIAQLRCSHFIDDLLEILGDPGFPSGVRGLLFDPNDANPAGHPFSRINAWNRFEWPERNAS